jgi:hypothetical protein
MGAKTRADLSGLFADLPGTAHLPGTGAPAASALPDVPRRRHGHPILLLAVLVILAIAAAHAVAAVTMPWVWLGIAFLAVLFITRGGRHSHHHRQQNQEQ